MNNIAELVREATGDRYLRVSSVEKALYQEITDDLIDADRRVFIGEGYHGFPCWNLYRVIVAQDYTTLSDLRTWTVAFAFAHAECGGLRSDARDPDMIVMAAWDALHFAMYKRWALTVRDVSPTAKRKQVTYGRFRKALAGRMLAALDGYTSELQYQLRKVVRLNKAGKLYSGGNIGWENSNRSRLASGCRIVEAVSQSDDKEKSDPRTNYPGVWNMDSPHRT